MKTNTSVPICLLCLYVVLSNPLANLISCISVMPRAQGVKCVRSVVRQRGGQSHTTRLSLGTSPFFSAPFSDHK